MILVNLPLDKGHYISVRTLFIPRQTDLWTQVSLIRTAFAALPTIHHTAFHIGRHTFAPLPTRIVGLRSLVRTAFAATRKSPQRFDLNCQIR